MSEKIKIYTSGDLQSKGDKARAAAKLGQKLAASGNKVKAGNVAAHELKHAVSKKTTGRFGIEVDPKTHAISGAFYEHETTGLNDQDLLDIISAPGPDMSESDKKQYEEARLRQAKKKNWLLNLRDFIQLHL